MQNNPQTEAELESFRQKWREEVSARTKQGPSRAPGSFKAGPTQGPIPAQSKGPAASRSSRIGAYDGWDDVEPRSYHDLEEKPAGRRLGDDEDPTQQKEPQSALEHYEKAVERETQGSLGDSVSLYRKAFKLDSDVHEAYKKKHFPPSSFAPHRPANPNPSNAPVTVPNTAHHSLHGLSPSVADLVAKFSNLSIPSEPPPTEASPPPPCPIAALPDELLVSILQQLAIRDLAAFARLSRVCKRLAYLVFTEEGIWRRIATGHEFGFAAMHYHYACDLNGFPIFSDELDVTLREDDEAVVPASPVKALLPFNQDPSSPFYTLTPTFPTYRHMFRTRPRLRFNGCYISTVNYTRPGGASSSSVTWTSPVLIVTYYRYLRFFRDGSCISLLTTAEPSDVVHHMTFENLALYQRQHHKPSGTGYAAPAPTSTLPQAVMRDALRGRWRLSGFQGEDEAEGDVYVETEGVVPKYMWKMQFALGSAGRGARNNKLAWKGYWSYNRLTDDWGEFGLKNDRAFYWSRVKSFGMGW